MWLQSNLNKRVDHRVKSQCSTCPHLVLSGHFYRNRNRNVWMLLVHAGCLMAVIKPPAVLQGDKTTGVKFKKVKLLQKHFEKCRWKTFGTPQSPWNKFFTFFFLHILCLYFYLSLIWVQRTYESVITVIDYVTGRRQMIGWSFELMFRSMNVF